MRKILIFSLAYYPKFVGGAEVAIKEITDRISPDEIEFDMVTLHLDSNLPRYEKVGNINVHRVGWTSKKSSSPDSLSLYLHLNKYAFLLTGLFKAISLHHKRRYDAIWSLIATYNSFTALFFKIIFRKVDFIFTLQDGDPISYIKRRARPIYPLFKMIFTRADYIQTISKYLAGWAHEMGAKCPVHVVPNAVDFDFFSNRKSEESLDKLKKSLGKDENDVFLITTSRLVVKNAVGDIVESLQFLPENIKLVICGSGYQETVLKSKTKRLGLLGRVKFLGYISHEEMPQYLHISDIFIRPSLSEGFGNSFIEAMASGIPVIATPVGGIVDFLKDRETGFFCEVNNPKDIALNVEEILNSKDIKDVVVRNAKEMVKEKYEWGKIAGEMKRILSSDSIR